jgi:hypothetical protein
VRKHWLPAYQLGDPHDFVCSDTEVTMLGPNTVTRAALDVALLGEPGPSIMDADVEEMHASIVLAIVPADIGESSISFDHHGHSVELRMAWMKHMTRH